MDPFQILIDEHDHILRGLGLLDEVAARLERGAPAAEEQMAVLVRFIRRYADACHHAKEEQVLFDRLIAQGLPDEGGPIQVMLAEHVEGRGLIGRIQEYLDAPTEETRADAVGAARAFSSLLDDHIRKENEVLFMIGRNVLPPSSDAEVVAAYEKYEASAISADEKRELLSSLDALASEIAAAASSGS